MISLRRVEPEDREFLIALYASTRREELQLAGWDAETEDHFVRQQFTAQDSHYREHYPGASLDLVLLDGQPVGRLYVHRRANDIRLMDIALLPEVRGRGIGSRLLADLMAEATRSQTSLSIHVEIFNPARRLYDRLGFVPIEDRGVYQLLQWSSSSGIPGGVEPRSPLPTATPSEETP
jgi:GNAT superfamily N-acetyltransferase